MKHREPIRILVICTANICRSPVVEALLRKKLEQRNLSQWQIGSAGTLGVEGWPPAAESAAVMEAQGVDISASRSNATTAEMLAASDLVLCMEQAHVEAMRRIHPSAGARAHRLAEMIGERRDVADPYGGPIEHFEQMAAEVEDLLERGFDRIIALAREHHAQRIELGDQLCK